MGRTGKHFSFMSFFISFSNSSMALLHSIEQGLVEGQWIVINKVTLPLNSLLIPIIEAGLHWQKTNHSKPSHY